MRNSAFAIILRRELLEIFRDRRAVFFAVLLPALLWPGLLIFQGKLQRTGANLAESTPLVIQVSCARAPAWIEALREDLAEHHTTLLAVPAATSRARLLERLRAVHPGVHALLEIAAPSSSSPAPPHLEATFLSTSPDSRQAVERLRAALDRIRARELLELLRLNGIGADPADQIVIERRSQQPENRVRAARFALWIPMVLVMVLLSGASFAAIDVFAGERERGTLETLLVHPVRAGAITAGKYAAVLLIGWLCCLLNLTSLLLCFQLGLLGKASGELALPGAMAWGQIALQVFLLSLLLTALLVTICSRAKSFREGQNYVLPLTLAGILPAGLSALSAIHLTALSALVPILGSSLAIREAFAGRPSGPAGLLAAAATLATALWALRAVARTLDAERTLKEVVPDLEAERAGIPRRRALQVAAAAFLVHAYGAYQIAPHSALAQILFSLLLVLPLAGWVLWRAAGLKAIDALPLRRPHSPRLLIAALALGLGAPAISVLALELQRSIHPGIDLAQTSSLELLPPGVLLLLLALLPALLEEFFFRGVLLGASARGGRSLSAVALSALFFALFHLSPVRFLPTFALGLLLGHARLRSGTLWVPIAIHFAHNAIPLCADLSSSGDTLDLLLRWSPAMALALILGLLLLAKSPPRW